MMRGDRYTESSIQFKHRLIITLISNWQSMRLAYALDHIVIRLFEN